MPEPFLARNTTIIVGRYLLFGIWGTTDFRRDETITRIFVNLFFTSVPQLSMDNFTNLFRSLPGISKDQLEKILNAFVRKTFKEKDFFCREGEICKHIGYIEKGCFSYYHMTEAGRKSIIHFAFEDWWVGDLESFINRNTATTYWQALENAEVITISRQKFDELYNSAPAFAQLYQAKTNTAYLKSMKRSAINKVESAEEKYLRLMDEQPLVLQRVPHYEIAAYLGIAPESLSRIRKKLTLKK
jgi:CRP/FNR family transcriptional regulator, anaerobic regulatory protein